MRLADGGGIPAEQATLRTGLRAKQRPDSAPLALLIRPEPRRQFPPGPTPSRPFGSSPTLVGVSAGCEGGCWARSRPGRFSAPPLLFLSSPAVSRLQIASAGCIARVIQLRQRQTSHLQGFRFSTTAPTSFFSHPNLCPGVRQELGCYRALGPCITPHPATPNPP